MYFMWKVNILCEMFVGLWNWSGCACDNSNGSCFYRPFRYLPFQNHLRSWSSRDFGRLRWTRTEERCGPFRPVSWWIMSVHVFRNCKSVVWMSFSTFNEEMLLWTCEKERCFYGDIQNDFIGVQNTALRNTHH